MKHHKKGRALGREKSVRKALLKNLARALVLKEKIKTTEAKAKELRPFVERLITLSKKNSLAQKRLLISRLGDKDVVQKLMSEIGPRFSERKGGYTRIIKLNPRLSDSSAMAIIEFV